MAETPEPAKKETKTKKASSDEGPEHIQQLLKAKRKAVDRRNRGDTDNEK